MTDKIRLFNGTALGYDEAIDSESDVLCQSRQWNESIAFKVSLFRQRAALESLVAAHLAVDAARVRIGHPKTWRQGAFNVVVPMLVFHDRRAARDQMRETDSEGGGARSVDDSDNTDPSILTRVVLRCPLPTKCAEAVLPGSILEKMRCETAAYVWMQRHCPHVRIPHLYGFGFPNGLHFTCATHLNVLRRAALWIRQCLASLLRQASPSSYLPVRPRDNPLPSGYMVIEYFGANIGRELPFVARRQNMLAQPVKMANLFRGVSQIMLAIARIPQPRIGAFRFNYDGTISLDNRPITCEMLLLENEGAPRTMAVDMTYSNVDQYVADMARFHDHRLLAAPNAALDRTDCEDQMAAQAFLHAVSHHFVSSAGRRNGPFVLSMSDQNPANIMVDDDWNVTGIFDLEWIISAPVNMVHPPSWLAWDAVDINAGEGYAAYNEVRQAFMRIFQAEERQTDMRALEAALAKVGGGASLSAVMEESWATDCVWFYDALLSLNAMVHLVRSRLSRLFHFDLTARSDFYRLWDPNAKEIVTKKLDDRAAYMVDVARLFGRDRDRDHLPLASKPTGVETANGKVGPVLSVEVK